MSTTTVPATLSGTYTIDPTHSRIGFVARHAMVTKVRGSFNEFAGSGSFDAENPADSRLSLTIQAASIDTRNPDRDGHLRSNDFFAMDEYPEITFRSTSVEQTGDAEYRVTGDLTIKGITKPVTWDVTYSPIAAKGFKGELRRGFSATTQINRKEFGLTYSKAVEVGPVVGDTVKLEVDAEAIQQEPKAAETSAAAQAKDEKPGKK